MSMFWLYVAALFGLFVGMGGKLVWPAVIVVAALAVGELVGLGPRELLAAVAAQI